MKKQFYCIASTVFFIVLTTVFIYKLFIYKLVNNIQELVVATCKEDLSWIDEVSEHYDRVTVYDKCNILPTFKSPNVSVESVPNVGSCDNAFLTYIIDRYETLPHKVEFTKGKSDPLRHNYIHCQPCEKNNSDDLLDFKLKHWQFTNNTTQQFEFIRSNHENMRDWVEQNTLLNTEMFAESGCNVRYGGYFAVTREQIMNMPKYVYKNLWNQQHHANAEVDHFIERSWGTMFCTSTPVSKLL
jgi:hypothetical protein